jgi:predicted nuclease with TOPRIM domain
MTNFNSSDAPQSSGQSAGKTTAIYAVLIFLLLATLGLLFKIWYDKTGKDKENTVLNSKVITCDSSKNVLQAEYNSTIQRLNDLTLMNKSMDSLVRVRNGEVESMKTRIQTLLNKENKSEADMAEAKRLIAQLNGQITSYVEQIAQLKKENTELKGEITDLNTENNTLKDNIQQTTQEKEAVEEKLDEASTLVASNISLVAIDERRNGKQVEREKARRVDLLKLTFTVFNRVGNDGEKELYIIIKDPSGTVVSTSSLGSGQFSSKESGTLLFTTKKSINFQAGLSVPVTVDWKPGANFTSGTYKVEVYNNGFLIGSASKTMK